MSEFAKAWSKYLPKDHRDALFSALGTLSDEFFEDDLEDEEHIFRELLPRKYFLQYTPGFLKRFFVTLLTVGYKLALPKKSDKLIACTAEEIALHILIGRASVILEDEGIDADFTDFKSVIY